MQKVTGFLIIVVLYFVTVSFVPKTKEKIQWLTVAQLNEAYRKNPKPILVDVYTSWCGWCKVMDRQTYGNAKVVSYINEHYYAVKLNAEQKDSLEWNGKKYGYDEANKVNELAVYLCYGQLSFPTTVFVTDINAQPAALPGYLKVREIETPLNFFGESAYKTQNFQDFNKAFTNNW